MDPIQSSTEKAERKLLIWLCQKQLILINEPEIASI